MNRPNDEAPPTPVKPLPRPNVKPMRWPFPLVWIVPILALALAGYYFYHEHRERGPTVQIEFSDASGLKAGQSTLQLHGVEAGQVTKIELNKDFNAALVTIELKAANANLATGDTRFWVVRPQISDMQISGLATVVSGPYIEASPGKGESTTRFVGLEEAPLIAGPGVRVVLHSDHLDHLQVGSPVNYHGFQVGVVQDVRLSDQADQVNVTAFIWQRYAPLVRNDSRFWVIKGADIQGNILSGLKVQLGSLRTIISGGVAFATPTDTHFDPVEEGAQFSLTADVNKDWLTWAPRIQLPPQEAGTTQPTAAKDGQFVPSPVKGNERNGDGG